MARSLTTLIGLFLFWLLLSGMFVPFLLAAGLGSAIAVVLFTRRLDIIAGEAAPTYLNWFKFLAYCPWLIKEIMIAAWDVTKRILHPKMPISPTMVEFIPSQTTDTGLVIHANSITLTPGTISVEVEPGRFLVHALSREGGASLAGSEMDSRCTSLERH
jgi:multicomponent Na+:H+ antiporter subunit E